MAKKKAKKSAPRAPRKKSAFDEFEENRLEDSPAKGRAYEDDLADPDFGDDAPSAADVKNVESDAPAVDRDPPEERDETRPASRRGDAGHARREEPSDRRRGRFADDDDVDDDDDDIKDDDDDDDLDDALDDALGIGDEDDDDEPRGEKRAGDSRTESRDRYPRQQGEGRRPERGGFRRPAPSRDEEGYAGPGERRNHRPPAVPYGERDDADQPADEERPRDVRPGQRRGEQQGPGRRRPRGPYRSERPSAPYSESRDPRDRPPRGNFDDLESALDEAFDEYDEAPANERAPEGEFESAPAEPPPPPRVLEPDDQESISALRNLGARLDVDPEGHVWRVILYGRQSRDGALAHMRGLPGLRDLWVIGTAVTKAGVEALKSEMPTVKVYA
jgi:hypothetical protein